LPYQGIISAWILGGKESWQSSNSGDNHQGLGDLSSRHVCTETRNRITEKLQTLERHKAMMDILATFLKAHQKVAVECSIHPLQGKLGLKFEDYALAVPYVKKGSLILKLVKSGDDWRDEPDERVASEDVSGMSDDEFENLLRTVYQEANPKHDQPQ
jgi:hypothetical protein